MEPEIFIQQKDVKGLISIFMKFASKFPIATDRQDILNGAGVGAKVINSINPNTIPVVFANSLLAKFREYKLSNQRLDYHPMITFLSFLLNTGAGNYGLEDQGVALCQRLIERGKENFNALKARNSVGRIESPKGTGIGTCVLVAKDLLLTCHHIFSKGNIQQAWVRFDYKENSYSLEEDFFELDLNFVSAHNQPDYALVKINGQPKQKIIVPLNKTLSSGQESRIRIIHHPQGNPVVVSDVGQIVQEGADYIDHNLSTDEGSSGAPVFDQEWDLVAIHRGRYGMGRDIPPDTTEAVPIHAIWDKISPHLT
ncbi:MAG: trypsin-like peptidase domain-containing protein [Deltaproteobacteria bacterium]|nr:trypsin-like peptidase domain-containing protein [Deltaproteobacteria bacterium]